MREAYCTALGSSGDVIGIPGLDFVDHADVLGLRDHPAVPQISVKVSQDEIGDQIFLCCLFIQDNAHPFFGGQRKVQSW